MASKEELEAMGIFENEIENNNSTNNNKNKKSIKDIKENMRANTYLAMQNSKDMILSTTNEIKGYNINKYIGNVGGTDIYLIGGILGGGLASQEQLYANALMNTTSKLKQNAKNIGANAVIGIQSNLTSAGGTNNIIVTLTGTAVDIEKQSE